MAGDTHQDVRRVFGTPLRSWIAVYLKGLAMGTADSVPGVSGGTIAFITGIYERLITAITALDPTVLRMVPSLHRSGARKRLYARLIEMDLPFLVVLGTGVATAVVTVSRVVHVAIVDFPAPTFAFFFGLIAASAVILYRQMDLSTIGRIGAAAGGFGIAFFVSGITAAEGVPHTLPIILVAGAIAISAMILPGVSGAFFLLLLGQYEYLTGVLKSMVDLVVSVAVGDRAPGALVDPISVVGTFGVGAMVGLFTVAYAIRWALSNYRIATLSFLVSLMVGALRFPAAKISAETGEWTVLVGAEVVLAAAVGGGLVLVLDYYTADLDIGTAEDSSA